MPEAKEKLKKNAYEKALSAYTKVMKVFRKGDYARAAQELKAFIEEHKAEKEIVDRAKMYLAVCERRKKKETVPLKSFDDHYQYAVFLLNAGDYKQALRLLDKAAELRPKEVKPLYMKALLYARTGEVEKSLESLKEAVHRDKFFGILAQNEADFEPLREDKRFKIITKMA
ncbi:MAG: tetratricopeptide repeat protein [Candidatus Aminicenantales bacterium]